MYWLAKALKYADDGPVAAIEYADIAIDEADRAGLTSEKAYCLLVRAECLEAAGLYQSALASAQDSADILTLLDDKEGLSRALYQGTRLLAHRLCRHEEVLNAYAQYDALALQLNKTPATRVPSLCLWAITLEDRGLMQQAEAKIKETIALARTADDPNRLVLPLQIYGVLALKTGDDKTAVACMEDLFSLAPKLSAGAVDAQSLLAPLGQFYLAHGRADEARRLYHRELAVISAARQNLSASRLRAIDESNLDRNECQVYSGLGSVEFQEGNYESALQQAQRAQQFATGEVAQLSNAERSSSIGQAYIELGRSDDALAQFAAAKESRKHIVWVEPDRDDPELQRLTGRAYMLKGEYSKADRELKAALANCLDVSLPSYLSQRARVLDELGQLAEKQQHAKRAEKYYREALQNLCTALVPLTYDATMLAGLQKQLDETGERLARLLDHQQRGAQAQAVRDLGTAAHELCALANGKTAITDAQSSAAFANYRQTTTYARTLRAWLDWNGAYRKDKDKLLKQAAERLQKGGGKYSALLKTESAAIELDVKQRIDVLDNKSAAQLSTLRLQIPALDRLARFVPSS